MSRTIANIPEGTIYQDQKKRYGLIDNTDPVGEGVTKEWIVFYTTHLVPGTHEIFIVHAPTIKEAFEHFITIKPNTYVKGIEYYGIYF